MSLLPSPIWSSQYPDFDLPPGEIHVWRAVLDCGVPRLAELAALLNEEERARAERFLRSEDRLRFTASRGLLRQLLGWYLNQAPEQLSFSYGDQGRPFLQGSFPRAIPNFNLSHSGDLALFAFALDREVGVDIEALRDPVDTAAIAARYFHPEEAARLAALPEIEGRREFFSLWTRKEAYLKARGLGVGKISAAEEPDPDFQLIPLELEEGYVAALAYRGPQARLRLFCWI